MMVWITEERKQNLTSTQSNRKKQHQHIPARIYSFTSKQNNIGKRQSRRKFRLLKTANTTSTHSNGKKQHHQIARRIFNFSSTQSNAGKNNHKENLDF